MKIYDVPNFPNPLRVRIALAEKGVTEQVEFVPVDVMGGEQRGSAFLEKNPAGGVPVLEFEDGGCLSESSAITEYLDHAYGGIQLTGETPRERAVVHMLQRRAEFMVLDAVAAYFHHATEGLGPDLETAQIPAWGDRQKEQAINGMAYFNKLLEDRDFVAGNNFSVADITLFAGLVFAEFAGIEIPADYTHLRSWNAQVAARPSVESVLS